MAPMINRGMISLAKACVDIAAWVVALYIAAWVRLDLRFNFIPDTRTIKLLLLAGGLQGVLGSVIGLYRSRWIYGSFHEVNALVQTDLATSLLMFGIVSQMSARPIPRSSTLAGGAVALVFMAGARYLARLLRERWQRPDEQHSEVVRTIVFGAGEHAEQAIRSMLRDSKGRYVPVAIVDDDPAKRRLSLQGIKVMGNATQIQDLAVRLHARCLLIATPEAPSEQIRALTDSAEAFGLQVKVLPRVTELLEGRVSVESFRDVTEEDLLGRHTIETDVSQIAGYLRGKRVLVTGAGGSIGSELCRQIHRFSPASLMMLDRDESGLHAVQLTIEGRALLDDEKVILADIRDSERLNQIFAERKPEVVFHAAALKHLPLLERYPSEAIKTNVIGSLNVLDASLKNGVERFVNISTDKAANPISVLGFSKRAAERLTAAIAADTAGTYLSVRFGNVLGSRGSFIHSFRAQILEGGPVTVTDQEVTRFFMTIPEAVELVIQAGAIGETGTTLVLDMGQPVRIADVARRMIAKSGKNIRIVYTGLRPGEKLDEELFDTREVVNTTTHPMIQSARVQPLNTLGGDPESINEEKAHDLLVRWSG